MPPRCSLCGKTSRSSPDEKFRLLYFALTPEQAERKSHMKKNRMIGHPLGAHWFCETDRARAKPLIHLTWAQAKAELAKQTSPETVWDEFMDWAKVVFKE